MSTEGDVARDDDYRDLYDSAPFAYVSTLADGIIVQANQAFYQLTGLGAAETLGKKRFQSLLTLAGKVFHDTHFMPLLQMQGHVSELAFDMVTRDGRRAAVLVNSKLSTGRTPVLVRTLIMEAHGRRAYEQELLAEMRKAEEALVAKTALLNTLSHEIRTPLGVIGMATQILRRNELTADQEKYIGIIASSSNRMLEVVNDILDYSRITQGKLALVLREFNLRELVESLIESFTVKIDNRSIYIRGDIAPAIPTMVMGDPVKLRQVLTNLVGNAVKFTDRGGVTVSVRMLGSSAGETALQFDVADTGIGIAPSRLSRLFKDFSQADDDIEMKYGGSGLGLSISMKLVELFGGTIRVQSEPDRGSVFSFSIPLKLPARVATGA